ncbi:MAG: sigma-70 family RNA polymerase sigma factor [Calditrichaeota bacterium]|nr:MAG: sigma-70 family RNA polymerase sigma factor [Calditrichota bacterium]
MDKGFAESKLPLAELLDRCSDPGSPYFQKAWEEFLDRYKVLIYNNIIKRCRDWNVPRLRMQLMEAVDDIFGEILIILCKNNYNALRSFKTRDNERVFHYFLITTCHRAVGRYVQKHFLNSLVESEFENVSSFSEFVKFLDIDTRWELYETIVTVLRGSAKRARSNIERDIHIFYLYVFADFDHEQITRMPCLSEIGHRVIDNVVNRMRSVIRENLEQSPTLS